MKSARPLVLAALFLAAPLSRVLAGNAVIDWNQQALDATRLARNPPPHSALYLATFHIAIFDAVNGITRTTTAGSSTTRRRPGAERGRGGRQRGDHGPQQPLDVDQPAHAQGRLRQGPRRDP
jgi:hypothetical protein